MMKKIEILINANKQNSMQKRNQTNKKINKKVKNNKGNKIITKS